MPLLYHSSYNSLLWTNPVTQTNRLSPISHCTISASFWPYHLTLSPSPHSATTPHAVTTPHSVTTSSLCHHPSLCHHTSLCHHPSLCDNPWLCHHLSLTSTPLSANTLSFCYNSVTLPPPPHSVTTPHSVIIPHSDINPSLCQQFVIVL